MKINKPSKVSKLKKNQSRFRRLSGWSQFKLGLEDRLLMLLMYYRAYSTHIFLGFLFDIDDKQCKPKHKPLTAALGWHL